MSKTYVFSVGGSLIVTEEGVNTRFLKKFRAFIASQIKLGHKFYLIIGGGFTARDYVHAALETGKVNHANRDSIGIEATHLNAQLLKVIFGDLAHHEVITNPTKLIKSKKPLVFAAGYKPGWSTDYDAILIAKNNKIDTVINLSNIDHAYDKDPRHFKDAKKLINVGWSEFRKVVGNRWHPGANLPFDPIASREAAKNKMRVIILNGQNLKNLADCLDGRKFQGTTIG
jgi:uridylate kinase